jgi:superfamily II DNA/RNA helicase
MRDPATGLRRKIVIFTEPKDILDYLLAKIGARTGEPGSVMAIHGGLARETRRAAIAAFNSDPAVRILVANDAAASARGRSTVGASRSGRGRARSSVPSPASWPRARST